MLKKSTAVYLFTILCTLMVTPAQARQRSFVASYGNDANICDTFFPCRTFAKALTVTDPNGEVLALDSSGYGPVTLTQSVSLAAVPGAYAGIAVFPGTSGVTIGAGVSVVLRGLTINGLGGDNGILLSGISDLSIENCVISNLSGAGQHGVLVNAAATVRMVDTLVRDNDIGIQLQGGATTDISGSKFLGNNTGILVTSTASTITAVAISDTLVTGGVNGIEASSGTSGTSQINVIRATVTDNTVGVKTSASPGFARINLSDSMVTGNGTGLSQATSGTLNSLGNNTVTDNTPNTSGTIGSVPPM
ncbi:right-handed parallel beta-helix repeat-containing protein [Candidatus Nitrotoga arctica]|uniref:Right handed beta helix region n=1 Tax=Candidatus Nitrotoga arctica TaxID=453162 RepID=A0ABM8Z132_9PROT|nr:right-handed parallel beta-helix repeat-containing protein [Candidatus Nitrotoga arctica]CAG9933551.1 Right handed beta helix region [Candidatus Nitrotoga arctica]